MKKTFYAVALALMLFPAAFADEEASDETGWYSGAAAQLVLPQGGSRMHRRGGAAARVGYYFTGSLALEAEAALKNFYIGDFLIKKTVFVFKRNYMGEKTILSFEDITIDIKYKNVVEENEENKDNKGEEKSKSEGGLLDNIINIVIHNVEVKFKNIKIRFFDKENKNVEYAFFINNLEFKDSQNILQSIQPSEKIKYLFLHNKAVYIEGILFKEKYDEKDDIFFSAKEEDNETKNKFILNNNNLVYIKNKIEIDLYHDKDNNILNIGNNNVSDFYI